MEGRQGVGWVTMGIHDRGRLSQTLGFALSVGLSGGKSKTLTRRCSSASSDNGPRQAPRLKSKPKPVISFPSHDGRIMKGYTLRIMQWNIDFSSDNVFARTSQVIQIIGEEKPDIILLQEVSAIETGPRGSSFDLIKKKLVMTGIYELFADELIVDRHPHYFAVSLIRRRILGKFEAEYIRFRKTKMARHLVKVRANILTESGEDEICVLNSHMESLPSGFGDRMSQFQEILSIMRSESVPSIFGGDTNLRAREVRLVDVRQAEEEKLLVPDGKVDTRVSDAWCQAGSPPEAKFTWDARVNDNKEWLGAQRPYARFDRIFAFPGTNPDIRRPRAMIYRMVGTSRGPTDQFPSDHFGIVADINFVLPYQS